MNSLHRIPAALLLVAIGLLAAWVRPTWGQSGIVVTGADAIRSDGLAASPDLTTQLGSVSPRVILDQADAVVVKPMGPVQPDLSARLSEISVRVLMANADAAIRQPIGYPVLFFADSTAPAANQVTTLPTPNGTRISFTTSEWATAIIAYGNQPGVYGGSAGDGLLHRDHVVDLTGLVNGSTYYYRISLVDRSGNATQTTERSFVATSVWKVALPLLRK